MSISKLVLTLILAPLLSFSSFCRADTVSTYTLQDDDVVVTNGEIVYCINPLPSSYIIIPDTLDQQLVIGIENNRNKFYGTFSNRSIVSLSLPKSLKYIGSCAFSMNSIRTLDFSNLKELTSIGESAFLENALLTIDFTGCNSLKSIGDKAFEDNELIDGTILPSFSNPNYIGWMDDKLNFYPPGASVYDFSGSFAVRVIYQLTDADVIVTNGAIVKCNNALPFKDIIIPDTLDGQVVRSIGTDGYNGIFYAKGITSVVFPATLKSIGIKAFQYNKIKKIDFSKCDSLVSIGGWAFNHNQISECNLQECKGLLQLGYGTFLENPAIDSIGLPLPQLNYDGFIGWQDSKANTYKGEENFTNFALSYDALVNYTIKDEDVVVENGAIISCSYDFFHKRIIIPSVLDGQVVECIGKDDYNGVFKSKSIIGITLPNSIVEIKGYSFESNAITTIDFSNCQKLEIIGKEAFGESRIYSLDFSGCKNLKKLGYGAFISNFISTVNFEGCTALEEISEYCFRHCWLDSVDLSPCINLIKIGDETFYDNKIVEINFQNCTNIEHFGHRAFNSNKLKEIDLSPLTSLSYIDYECFRGNPLNSVNFSNCVSLEYIGRSAFRTTGLKIVDLNDCLNLKIIDREAFAENNTSSVNINQCHSLIEIYEDSFAENQIEGGI
ncbi:MAG: leucine-rich repeat protein, partial [Bacteroidales bacterium]|nr:leucine-rich repeat protein [Bacteroidales bacterium]